MRHETEVRHEVGPLQQSVLRERLQATGGLEGRPPAAGTYGTGAWKYDPIGNRAPAPVDPIWTPPSQQVLPPTVYSIHVLHLDRTHFIGGPCSHRLLRLWSSIDDNLRVGDSFTANLSQRKHVSATRLTPASRGNV